MLVVREGGRERAHVPRLRCLCALPRPCRSVCARLISVIINFPTHTQCVLWVCPLCVCYPRPNVPVCVCVCLIISALCPYDSLRAEVVLSLPIAPHSSLWACLLMSLSLFISYLTSCLVHRSVCALVYRSVCVCVCAQIISLIGVADVCPPRWWSGLVDSLVVISLYLYPLYIYTKAKVIV